MNKKALSKTNGIFWRKNIVWTKIYLYPSKMAHLGFLRINVLFGKYLFITGLFGPVNIPYKLVADRKDDKFAFFLCVTNQCNNFVCPWILSWLCHKPIWANQIGLLSFKQTNRYNQSSNIFLVFIEVNQTFSRYPVSYKPIGDEQL